MANGKRLTRVVPIRVSHEDRAALRRWAREGGTDVSKIVRRMIDEQRRRELAPEVTPEPVSAQESGLGVGRETSAQVGAAA